MRISRSVRYGVYAIIALIFLGTILPTVVVAVVDTSSPLTTDYVRSMLNSSGNNDTKVYAGDDVEVNNGEVLVICQRGSARYSAGFDFANVMAPIYAKEVFKTLFRDPRVLKVHWSVYNWQDDGEHPRSKIWGKAYEADRAYADQVEDWNKVNMVDLRVQS